jgi:hypothetical protein
MPLKAGHIIIALIHLHLSFTFPASFPSQPRVEREKINNGGEFEGYSHRFKGINLGGNIDQPNPINVVAEYKEGIPVS